MNSAFTLSTPHFEGPLDLLLTLIEERRLYINDISLADVTDAYMAHIQRITEFSMGETSQFVLVAATLLLIKSRSLLPDLELSEEEEGSIADLEQRLALYQRVKASATKLRELEPLHLAKAHQPKSIPTFAPHGVTITSLHAAIVRIHAAIPRFLKRAVVETAVSLEQVISSLASRLQTASRLSFREVTKGAARHDIIVHFLALLELVKSGSVTVDQRDTFGELTLENNRVDTPRYT